MMRGKNRRLWFSLGLVAGGFLVHALGGLAVVLTSTPMLVGNSFEENVDSLPRIIGEMSWVSNVSAVASGIALCMILVGLGLLTYDLFSRALARRETESIQV